MLISIFVGIIIIKFVIWLLPVILIMVLAYLIYKSIKKNKYVDVSVNNTKKKRPMKVIHDLTDED